MPEKTLPELYQSTIMTEEACRTRSQKRALEREITQNDVDCKKMKIDKGLLGAPDANTEGGDLKVKSEPTPGRVQGLLKGGEMKATIKVEVQTGDEPVDMSTSKSDIKRERRVPSPDVIVLSDNEPSSPRMNGLTKIPLKETSTEVLMKSSPEEREQMIKQLKEELRLEEAKLVLLKKLRQSQIQKETTAQKPTGSSGNAVATPPPLVRGTQSIASSKSALLQNSSRIPGTVIPPPLIRGGQQASSKLGSQQNTQIVMPPLVRGAQPISVSPQQIHNIRQHSSSGPPPLLLAPRASVPSVQIQGQRIIQQGLIRVANVPNASLLVNIPQASPTSLKGTAVTAAQVNAAATATSVASIVNSNDSPASRQAAAKLALRKQLEKTLLEIPPPKPPAPEMNFLPSAANNEFIYLVGLEEVVQNLLEAQGKVSAAPSSQDPYTCVQCKTDFTCRWREEKSGSIMCETCMSSNQKKALKAEHTSRLKAAFVKALQQEQEIEQRILQQAASPVQTKPEQIAQQHHSLKQASSQLPRSASTPRGVLHAFSPSPKLQNAASSVAVLGGRQGKRAQRPVGKGSACTWKKTLVNAGGTLNFVNPSLAVHKTAASAVDRQREYLLDMIPPRSISQSATWK
ncbi:transcriptional repressor p66-alpha isoform X1 [Zootoca vivipara]|uniref:transcriptional repressor p66-alpha isoform X1 n=2 Tax=Zootoca vivipara TaxID=8524 RepID=UPI0015913F43|nr:transcriptional repressor p66-alpha isoform X1 [Zootoca vivipara]XP_034973138.1 transcriptional repressor p66-alpha isoform X1 [Zootoca vivipara]XP_034973139.1 transcriptional repressor p66-alpha isoform X1 [Zootoca vivipara]XP_034973140.1 transcriptional repressor p66-alpha isoform X1 [Zootoca vivipara]XP_034973141.1 transcriptional repressor p66-alpha isoform X1 [Zootoca vivipara]